MKKMNNKGFSLVELIIVIAIMAILAGAIAPALIRYIDKSRKSNDVSSCKTIKTAIETALGNETVYEYLTAAESNGFCYIYITPGEPTSTELSDLDCIDIVGESSEEEINGKSSDEILKIAENEIATNIGEKTPKLKYKKNAEDPDNGNAPEEFVAVVSKKGTVYVFIATAQDMTVTADDETGEVEAENGFQICPNVCDEYQ